MSIPRNYSALLPVRERQQAIQKIRDFMRDQFSRVLNCTLVECPLIVESSTGVNDQLDSKKMPVKFTVPNTGNPLQAEVIQATTKWKRLALKKYGFKEKEGLFVDMKGIRKDYFLDMNHSCFVNQWDWELIVSERERNLEYLKQVVRKLYKMILDASRYVSQEYPSVGLVDLPEDIHFIHTEDLYQMFPKLSRNEREEAILNRHKAVFLIGIGYPLGDGNPHEDRASDYDDWYTPTSDTHRGLNGDILVWNDVIKRRFELSSMGIRVTPDVLRNQLEMNRDNHLSELLYDKALLSGELPLTIGGGVGQARVLQLLLKCAHIGEVSVSPWTKKEVQMCKENNIELL